MGAGKYILGAVAGVVALPVTLSALGFGAAGVAAGSVAAATQSAVYGGATTGVFSVLTAWGAAGAPAAATGM